MAQVLVRNLPDQVVGAFKRRAREHGVSLEQELRDVLTAAARPVADRVDVAARLRTMTLPGPQSDSTQLIREDRDRR